MKKSAWLWLIFCCLIITLFAAQVKAQTNDDGRLIVHVDCQEGQPTASGTISDPLLYIKDGINMLKSKGKPGDVLKIAGGICDYADSIKNRLAVNGLHGQPQAWFEIRGSRGPKPTRIRGWNQKFSPHFDPTTMSPIPWGAYNVVSVSNSSYVRIKNILAEGGNPQTLEINSKVNAPTHDIEFVNVEVSRSGGRGAFIVGTDTQDITFIDCKFGDQLNSGPSTHVVYVSGGHWNSQSIFRGFNFIGCEFWGGYRWGIQFNGRIKDVVVDQCVFHHLLMGAVQFIGVQNASVMNNIVYAVMKQAFSLYMYFDTSYWDPYSPESVKDWIATHWTNKDIIFDSNTIVRPKEPWTNKKSYHPKHHATFLFNKTQLVDQLGLDDFTGIELRNNIVTDHYGKFIYSKGTDLNADYNYYENNLVYNFSKDPSDQSIYVDNNGQYSLLSELDADLENWNRHVLKNPVFVSTQETFIEGKSGPLHWERYLSSYKEDSSNDFRVLRRSPVVDAGHRQYYPPEDYDGRARPIGEFSDIGAYEHHKGRIRKPRTWGSFR